MRSKAFHAFEQKISHFNGDIELIDVLQRAVNNGDLTDEHSRHVLKYVDAARHSNLARRQNRDGSRKLVMSHLRATVYSSYVKDAYEEVTQYLKTILEQASQNGINSGRLIGEHSFKVDAKTVLELGDWTNVCRMVSESVFQSLEAERSTLKLLEKMANKLALNVSKDLILTALPYLEIRHFLVHADGKVTSEYAAEYPHIALQAGRYISLSYTFITSFRSAVQAMISDFDREVVARNLLSPRDMQP